MPDLLANINFTFFEQAPIYGVMINEPMVFTVPAIQMAADKGISISSGQLMKSHEIMRGTLTPLLGDTFITGSAGKSGTAFTIGAGSGWTDNSRSTRYDQYRLMQSDGSIRSSGSGPDSCKQTTPDTNGITTQRIIITRSFVGGTNGGGGSIYSPLQTYTWIYLAWESPDDLDYRIALEYGNVISIDYTEDAWVSYIRNPLTSDGTGITFDEFFSISQEMFIDIIVDRNTGKIFFLLRGGDMHHSPDSTYGTEGDSLPEQGCVVIATKNGQLEIECYPLRSQGIDVSNSRGVSLPTTNGQPPVNAGSATMVAGGEQAMPDGMQLVNTMTIGYDENNNPILVWSFTANNPDDGYGNGSVDSELLSSINIIIPSYWSDQPITATIGSVPITPYQGPWVQQLPVCECTLREVFDQQSRILGSSARMTIPDIDNIYPSQVGEFGCNISIQSQLGGPFFQQMLGMAGGGEEGITFERDDATGYVEVPVYDRSRVMMRPLLDRVRADRNALPSIVRYLAEKGNIHGVDTGNLYQTSIPDYLSPPINWFDPIGTPPYTVPVYPYGPVWDSNCPYYILATGSGDRPRYDWGPETIPWSNLQLLVQDLAVYDPTQPFITQNNPGGPLANILTYPFIMGFDGNGYLLFQPYDAISYNSQAYFSEDGYYDQYNNYYPIEEIKVSSNSEWMRTALNFQGLDWRTNELLNFYLPLPPYVFASKGYTYPWMERSARFSDTSYLLASTLAASVQASIPQIVCHIKGAYCPNIHAGMKITVSHRVLGGSYDFVIEQKDSTLAMMGSSGKSDPSGRMVVNQYLVARSVNNYIAM